MSPLPNTQLFHPSWSEHHRPVAEMAMTSAVRIDVEGEPTWDSDTDSMVPSIGAMVYVGPARIQELTSASALDAAGQAMFRRRYQVSLPASVGRGVLGQAVEVTQCKEDPSLVGSMLRVEDYLHGSQLWQRDLICSDEGPR